MKSGLRRRDATVHPAAIIVLLVALAGHGSCALAQGSIQQTKELDAARDRYIEALEQRVRSLEAKEERLRALEKKIEVLTSIKGPGGAREQAGPNSSGWSAETKLASPSDPGRATSDLAAVAEKREQVPSQGEVTSTNTQTSSGKPPALAAAEDQDALRDLQVIRDQAVTVKQGNLDIGTKLDYLRANSTLQFSRAFVASTTLRYGILPGVEISATVPVYDSVRKTQITPIQWERNEIFSIGDIAGQVTGTLFRETLSLPGIFGYLAITAPTGPDPYWIPKGERPFAQPINPLYFTQSSGHYSGTIGVTAAKTIEPIILFAGLSYTHFLPANYGGSEIQPGDRYGYKLGFGLAVSERTMIGAAVQGSIAQDLVMDSTKRFGASAESVLLTLSLTQRIAMGFFFEPGVTIGMTDDAPAAAVSIGVRKSF